MAIDFTHRGRFARRRGRPGRPHQLAAPSGARRRVGLIYKYFGGKEDLLLATILRIQDAFRD
jgi:hypothetical protein